MNACPSCGEVIDVSSCAPYSKVLCPSCSTPIRVRGEFLQFQIQKKIGEGGMSRVFRAVDQTLGRQVALKILNPDLSTDDKRAEEFEREAKITAAISHPNVVKVYSAGQDQDHYFIAMELVGGGSLDERITAGGPVAEAAVLDMAAELVQGLNAAHEAGLIHRDMKPGNVLFSDEGTSKIVDFGLALVLEHADEDDGEIWATPYYVPPEKLYKEPEDFRSDIYSLGATLFHALAGSPPYSADTSSIEELKAIKDRPISLEMSAPGVSMATCELVDRMMARQPDARYTSYQELLEHVNFARQGLLDGGWGNSILSTQQMRRKVEEGRARTAALALFAVVVAVLGSILGYQFYNRSGDSGDGGDGGTGVGGGDGGGIVLDEGAKSTTEKFEGARQLLVAGKFGKAGQQFGEIAAASSTRQPTANWALFNQGLCALLQGKVVPARDIYQNLAERAEFSSEERDLSLVTFFEKSGELLGSPLPVGGELASLFDATGTEALALLACGLKDWEMGAFSAAPGYFRAFRDAELSKPAAWIADFQPLLKPYLHDLDKLQKLPPYSRSAGYEESKAALEKSRAILGQLQLPSVRERIEKRIARLKRSVAKLEVGSREAEATRLAQLKTIESRRLAQLLISLDPYRDGLRFEDGVELLEADTFEHPETAARYADELYIWKAAASFVDTLIGDINRFGYSGAVEQRSGSNRVLKLVAADRERITYQFGAALAEAKIPLAQVTERSLLSIADRLSRNFPDMDEYLPRREKRALFAYVVKDWETAIRASDEVKGEEFRALWGRIVARERGS